MLLRIGFLLLAAGLAGDGARRRPGAPGWPSYLTWAVAGLGMGLGMPSLGVLLLDQSPEQRRGADSAAFQIADVDRLRAVRRASWACWSPARDAVAARSSAAVLARRRRRSPRSPLVGRWLAAPGRRPAAARRTRPFRATTPGDAMTYLDHAATTPLLPEVLAAMTEQLGRVGNASSLHASGRAARRAAEQSRERLAEALGARPSEVLFTGGGTESDNLAVKGLFWARRQADSRRRRIVVSPAEHHAVLDSVEWLAKHDGAEVTWLPVEPTGRVAADALAEALGDGTRRRGRQRDVGQQRDRHRERHPGSGRRRARGGRAAAHRRGAGGRPGAGRLRRVAASTPSP